MLIYKCPVTILVSHILRWRTITLLALTEATLPWSRSLLHYLLQRISLFSNFSASLSLVHVTGCEISLKEDRPGYFCPLALHQLQSGFQPKPKRFLWPIIRDADSSVNQTEFEEITCNQRQARENARVQLGIDFGFASHWLRKGRKFCQPITERSKAKPKLTRIIFDTQFKTALSAANFTRILNLYWPKEVQTMVAVISSEFLKGKINFQKLHFYNV